MSEPTQNYQNHRRFVPLYHMGVFGVFAVNLVLALWGVFKAPGLWAVWGVLNAAAMVLLFFFARLFAITAQDRVIRLEERLRLSELLPADLKPRIGELTPGQLVALRFASDEELPLLTRRVLEERIADRDAIKRLIQHWRPDHLRV